MRKFCLVMMVMILSVPFIAFANNIQISNVELKEQNSTDDYTMIEFDLDWENSWRIDSGPSNWDAAWIFVKYQVPGDSLWHHVKLNNNGHSAGSGTSATVETGLVKVDSSYDSTHNPGVGAFIYRNSNGSGIFSADDIRLRWNYGADGLGDASQVNIKVFAIEMVYVPQGSFYLGSGGNENNCFYDPADSGAYLVTSEDAISVGTSGGNLYYDQDNAAGGDQGGPIPADFPKGYKAFYCMKYEISQGQYVDFLNTLGSDQKATHYYSSLDWRDRYTISPDLDDVYSCTSPYVACSFLSWADLEAYFDWSGLRPMTELEYQKACRGTIAPFPNEYAWGDTSITDSSYSLENSYAANEGISSNYNTVEGNVACFNTHIVSDPGPFRVGIFAANASNTGRVTSGATYYGIMEMSGNLWERNITVGNPEGRSFTGTHGDGSLTSTGEADVTSWPGSTSVGSGFFGGNWKSNNDYLRVSNRHYGASQNGGRYHNQGGRGLRQAP